MWCLQAFSLIYILKAEKAKKIKKKVAQDFVNTLSVQSVTGLDNQKNLSSHHSVNWIRA